MQLIQEADEIFSKLEAPPIYFIVDVGHAHLPGIAKNFLDKNIDCYFVIPERINNRFHETIKYWAKGYETAKSKIISPKSYATFIDCHRQNKFSTIDFPTSKRLEELGIKRVIYFNEAKVGSSLRIETQGEMKPILKEYQNKGFDVGIYGIDPRKKSKFPTRNLYP